MKPLEFIKTHFFKITTLGLALGVIGIYTYASIFCTLVYNKNKELMEENSKLSLRLAQANLVTTSQKDSNEELKSIINTMTKQQKKLISDNKKLNNTNNKYLKQLKKFQKRKELFDKYEYAIIADGKRTDLTYDQIKTGDELMKEKGYDPNLLFGIIMVESSATEKMTSSISTARGYGQILKGTGSFIYNTLMNRTDPYNHSYALNGKLNIAMMTEYLDYLITTRDNNLYKAIQGYRGKTNVQPYIRGIDNYIINSGTSVAEIATEIRRKDS